MSEVNNFEELKQCLPKGVSISKEDRDSINKFTRPELDSLSQEIKKLNNLTNTSVNDAIKKYIEDVKSRRIGETRVETGIQAGELKKETQTNQIKSYPNTPEGMKKFFEEFEKGKPEKAARYLVLSNMLKYFIYDNNLDIDENGFIGSNFKVCKKDGKEHTGFSEILNQYMTSDDFKNIIAFEAAYSSGSIEKRALEIANRHNIVLSRDLDNSAKSLLRTQIKNKKDILEKDKMILFMYLDGEGKDIQKMSDDYVNETKQSLSNNATVIAKLSGRDKVNLFDQKNLEKYARDPGKLIFDVLGGMGGFLPIAIFTVILECFKVKNGVIMRPLRAMSAIGVAKGFGIGDNIGDAFNAIPINESASDIWDGTKWAANKFAGACQEGLANLEVLAYLRNYNFTSSEGSTKDIFNSDFESLFILANKPDSTSLRNQISRSDNKPREENDIKELQKIIIDTYNKGIKKHGKEKFDKAIKGESLWRVIDMATDNNLPVVKMESKTSEPKENKEKPENKKDKNNPKKPDKNNKTQKSSGEDEGVDLNKYSKSETPKNDGVNEDEEKRRKLEEKRRKLEEKLVNL